MDSWIWAKQSILDWTGLDRDSLNILISMMLGLLAALATRRPLASLLSWFVVLAIGLANEASTVMADGRFASIELAPAARDLGLFMTVPTMLMLVGRFAPHLIAEPRDRRIHIPTVWEKRASVVEASFREDDPDPRREAANGRTGTRGRRGRDSRGRNSNRRWS